MTQQNFTPLRGESTQPSIEERWDELRSSIRKTWPELSKEDLKSIDGDSRKLIALVHQKTGADLHEIEEQIDRLAASSAGLLSRVARTARQAFSNASERIAEPFEHAYSSTRQTIVNSPERSIGIAFGVGLVIGLCTASLIKDATSAPQRRFW
jgi:ElaB/YqjD/DUF883 family membrane-anchored ribosome-binding protein